MFTIESKGIFRRKSRLVASTELSREDFRKVADQIGRKPIRARKIAVVAARKASGQEAIETRWDGKESTNTAQPGDWIVTSLTADDKVLRDKDGNANTYVIKASTFPSLYDPATGGNDYGQFFKSKRVVEAVYFSGGFDVMAPWGQKQIADAGYLLLSGEEVYGNNAQTFDAAYEIVH